MRQSSLASAEAKRLTHVPLLQTAQTASSRFPLTAEASTCTWVTVPAPNSTARKVRAHGAQCVLCESCSFVLRPPWFRVCHPGAVCVRVPSSLRAAVELCGATVDVSPQVPLHGLTQNTTERQTTVTGKRLHVLAQGKLKGHLEVQMRELPNPR